MCLFSWFFDVFSDNTSQNWWSKKQIARGLQRYPAVQEPGSSKINRNNSSGSRPGQGPEFLPLWAQFTLGSWWRQTVACTFWSWICGYRIHCVRAPREDNVIVSCPTLGWCREGEVRPLCTAEAPGGAGRERLDPCVPQRPLVEVFPAALNFSNRKYLNACKLYIVRILNVAFYLAQGKGMFDSWKEFWHL